VPRHGVCVACADSIVAPCRTLMLLTVLPSTVNQTLANPKRGLCADIEPITRYVKKAIKPRYPSGWVARLVLVNDGSPYNEITNAGPFGSPGAWMEVRVVASATCHLYAQTSGAGHPCHTYSSNLKTATAISVLGPQIDNRWTYVAGHACSCPSRRSRDRPVRLYTGQVPWEASA